MIFDCFLLCSQAFLLFLLRQLAVHVPVLLVVAAIKSIVVAVAVVGHAVELGT